MAKPVSSIESHPQRQKIIDAILAGQSLRLIASKADPAVSPAAISRFASRISRNTAETIAQAKAAIANKDKGFDPFLDQAVTRAAMTAAVDPFMARAVKSDARRDRWMEACEADADYRTLASLDRNDLTAQQYQAQLAGRLESGVSLNVNIVCPAGPKQQPAAEDATIIDVEAIE